MRIDLFLTEKGYVPSRKKAQMLIEEGKVSVDGRIVQKSSQQLGDGEHTVEIAQSDEVRYVGRGGLKLEAALDAFGIDASGKIALDIGASTGGFTDCLLCRGAKKVYAVDAGVGQLAKSLLANPSVISIEKLNARNLLPEHINNTCVNLIVMDVSFISATYIIPQFPALMTENGEAVCLVKPQFEVGRAMIGKGGIVRDRTAHADAIKRVCASAESVGLFPIALIPSPIEGGDGNREFLLHLVRQTTSVKVLTAQQIFEIATK
ncbi:MAG: TlyA family RNA methyltransferase [Ruminococcaceae bacterium]|nr:TlyA family RNA methyltransferase [Oscillospiraceae bacterium]